ncbi:MAG TPA: ribosomal protein S18-alanine N-acetyltransferase [Terracidiphilus sp.]|jgi:ribosomal-protein-alanine N-acetyltransferase|nr:ribosomal protein S18-alanine N-acetyltransferase [Terracidiphilus sp.]
MIIRPMQVSDLDRVLEIARSLPQAPRWARDVYEAALQPGSAPQRVALVAETDVSPEVAGFMVAAVVGPDAELETIGVAESWQRRGVGRQLLRALARVLGGAGVSRLTLEVRALNAPAQRLYRSAGCEEVGRRASYYADPKEDAIVMAVEITVGMVGDGL